MAWEIFCLKDIWPVAPLSSRSADHTVDWLGFGLATVEWVAMNFEFARLLGSGRRRIRRLFGNIGIWSGCLLLAIMPEVAAQGLTQIAKPSGLTPYPRTNLATGYEVVSSWPARPKDLTWGAMAGIADQCNRPGLDVQPRPGARAGLHVRRRVCAFVGPGTVSRAAPGAHRSPGICVAGR